MADVTLDDIARKLDLLLGTIQLAHAAAISSARGALLADHVNKAVYDATFEWVPAGALISDIAAQTGVATRTVHRRVAELVEAHVLESQGSSVNLKYRRTGLL